MLFSLGHKCMAAIDAIYHFISRARGAIAPSAFRAKATRLTPASAKCNTWAGEQGNYSSAAFCRMRGSPRRSR